jgi:hypothetical protein
MKAGIMVAAFAGIPLKTLIAPGQQQSGSQPPGTLFQIPVEVQNDLLNYYTSSTFKPYVNSLFQISLSRTDVKYLTLVEVKDNCPSTAQEAVTTIGDCFSLLFLGMRNQTSKQNTYQVKHPALGEFSLFLVPVGKRIARTNQQHYEAVINRRSP